MRYLVTWTIDAEDMTSPEEAARYALKVQRNPESIATFFKVKDENGVETDVDLWEQDGETDRSTTMDYGGVGQVGCENADGTLNVHGVNEYCDVCKPLE